jgi:ligand-binding SRPBCC domain-containing protein
MESGLYGREHDVHSQIAIQREGRHHVLRAEQWVPRPPGDVFPFFADPANLERITPEFLHFLRRRSTPEIGEGTILTYTLRLHGLPVLWRSRIEEWQPPAHFVDVQTVGPYAEWRHAHDCVRADGGTRLIDTVTSRLRCSALQGTPLLSWVHGDVTRIFEYRHQAIERLFAWP